MARHDGKCWTLPEDGVFDEDAVEMAAKGFRRVRLTPTEQLAAFRLMAAREPNLLLRDVVHRLGISYQAARELVTSEGFRIDTNHNASNSTRCLIPPRDKVDTGQPAA